jgi:hypothetical protein
MAEHVVAWLLLLYVGRRRGVPTLNRSLALKFTELQW